jgi:hypothetical protein
MTSGPLAPSQLTRRPTRQDHLFHHASSSLAPSQSLPTHTGHLLTRCHGLPRLFFGPGHSPSPHSTLRLPNPSPLIPVSYIDTPPPTTPTHLPHFVTAGHGRPRHPYRSPALPPSRHNDTAHLLTQRRGNCCRQPWSIPLPRQFITDSNARTHCSLPCRLAPPPQPRFIPIGYGGGDGHGAHQSRCGVAEGRQVR